MAGATARRGSEQRRRARAASGRGCADFIRISAWPGIFIGLQRGHLRMHRSIVSLFMVVAATVAVVAAPKFLAVWKSPEVSRLNFAGKKVAALVITDSQSLQMSGEEALTRELTARGVMGTPTYRFVPREELKSTD